MMFCVYHNLFLGTHKIQHEKLIQFYLPFARTVRTEQFFFHDFYFYFHCAQFFMTQICRFFQLENYEKHKKKNNGMINSTCQLNTLEKNLTKHKEGGGDKEENDRGT